jgi:predicted GTPase
MYAAALACSHLVIHVVRADQRDFRVDDEIFRELYRQHDKQNLFVVINAIDKIDPFDRNTTGSLSAAQLVTLGQKRAQIARQFDMDQSRIFAVSATLHIGLSTLVEAMSQVISRVLTNSRHQRE